MVNLFDLLRPTRPPFGSSELLQLGPVIARGCADGSLAADLPEVWTSTFVWTLLFTAHLRVRGGTRTWHEAAGLLTHTHVRLGRSLTEGFRIQGSRGCQPTPAGRR